MKELLRGWVLRLQSDATSESLLILTQLNWLDDDVQTDGCRDEVGAKERTWNLDGTFANK